MKLKIIGTILIAIAVSNGCSEKYIVEQVELNGTRDMEYAHKTLKNPSENEIKTFGRVATKVSMEPIWIDGDLITVYSIDDEDKILFIDTCAVYNANDNYGKIDAEVAKNCKGYFAVYPYDIMQLNVGDHIDFSVNRNLGGYIDYEMIKETGVFGDVDVMTSWCNWVPEKTGGVFYFSNRVSLLRVLHMKSSFAPIKLVIYKSGNNIEYTVNSIYNDIVYIPISTRDERITHMRFYYKSRSWNTYIDIYPKETIKVGHVYDLDVYRF